MFHVNGFFAPYAYLGMIFFVVFFLLSLLSGLMLGSIIGKKLIFLWVAITSCIIFYIFDLDYSFSILGFFAVSVAYVYFFKKFNKKTKNEN